MSQKKTCPLPSSAPVAPKHQWLTSCWRLMKTCRTIWEAWTATVSTRTTPLIWLQIRYSSLEAAFRAAMPIASRGISGHYRRRSLPLSITLSSQKILWLLGGPMGLMLRASLGRNKRRIRRLRGCWLSLRGRTGARNSWGSIRMLLPVLLEI